MVRKTGNTFAVIDDKYDFNIEWQNGFSKRNIATYFASLLHNGMNPLIPAFPNTPPKCGGPFYIRFHGNVTINP
jgi:hypothetical protein